MQRITSILIFLVFLGLLPVTQAAAGLFGDDTLVFINGNSYTTDDFKNWWKFWQEEEDTLPETPDPYINWLLLSTEAERMQLDQTPGFKRQTRVFLQSRTLLMLKYDEVDSKINITDADIRSRYEKKYLPRWLIQRLEFTDEKHALSAWQKLSAGNLTVGDLLKKVEAWKEMTGEGMTPEERLKRAAEYDGPVDAVENWLRPNQIETGWAEIFKKLEIGAIVDPNEHNKGRILYVLKDQKGADEEDLARFRDSIKKDLWKEEEDRLTRVLIDKLIDKYEVKINEERLAGLDINGADDTFTDAAIITSNQENVSEKQFIAVIRRLLISRPTAAHEAADPELAVELKRETANNIIYQAVTNWESLNRHYEEKEPFKWEYEFNYRHRLIQGLETQIIVPKTTVTEEEIEQHYKENPGLYKQPTLVKLYIIDETQAPLEQVWADVATGKDFKQAVEEYIDKPLNPREAPSNHLDPEVRDMVINLVDGETSQIFTAQGVKVLVHLIERTPEAPLPLERVKPSIRSKIMRDKLNHERSIYLEAIKANTEIEIKQSNWKKIQKELGGA